MNLERQYMMKKLLNDLVSNYNVYYKEYIGINKIIEKGFINICSSEYRDIPLNKKFLHYGILTKYQEQWFLSCSDRYKNIILNNFTNLKESNDIDYYLNNLHIKDEKIRKMYRMIWDGINTTEIGLRPEYEYVYMENLNKYVAKFNGKVISYCKISDIYYCFGNIVVYTNENFRKQGLATTLLNLLLVKCREKKLFPLYVVDSNNINSINLAKRLGFSIANEEIIISKELGD